MLATIEIVTLTTEICPACRRAHTIRAALAADHDGDEQLLGFFALCPAAGRRAWLVVRSPVGLDRRTALLAMGPPDDSRWEPREEVLDRVARDRSLHPDPVPPLSASISARLPTSELLRRALGCPYSPAVPHPA